MFSSGRRISSELGRHAKITASLLTARARIPDHRWRHSLSTAPSPSRDESNVLPLSGIRVLDLTRVLAGPFCTQLLADYGAEVIKIEHPKGGDETRQWRIAGEGDFWHKDKGRLMSLYFAAVNRNKRSVTLDLKSQQGKEIVKRLAKNSDVIINNFLPGTMNRLGLTYEEVKKINPSIVYASVSGYGETGPNSQRAGYDAIALAEAGLLHITGEADGPPSKPGVAIADLCTGLYLYGSILAAIRGRDLNGGIGCKVDGSLFESSLSLLINVGLASLNIEGKRGQRFGLGHPSLVPYGGFETADGRYIFLCANNDRQWKLFAEILRVEGLASDKRFSTNDARVANRTEIDALVGKQIMSKTLAEWMSVFEGSGLPYGAVNDVKEALEHEQSNVRGMVQHLQFEAAKEGMLKMISQPVKFEGLEIAVRQKPPSLGEHTTEVLTELGYDADDIDSLEFNGVV